MTLDFLQEASPVLYVILGAAVGALLYYLADRSVQTRAWKREYGIRNVERIYAPVYRDILSIPLAVRSYWYFPGPDESIKTNAWQDLNSSELRLFIPESIYTDLKEIYQVDLPAYLAAFDRCYRAILLTIREYIVTSSVNTRDIDAGRLDEFIRNRIYDYFRTYFIEGWEGLKNSFKTQEDFKRYVSNLVPQLAQGASQLCGAILPANFLDLMKDRTDTLQEMRECRMARDDLFKKCEKVSKELEGQIRQPWKI